MPMSAVDRIRAMQAGSKGINIGGSEPQYQQGGPYEAAPPMPQIQQDFQDFMAPRPQPMLPPDSALNTPVHYSPITGAGYVNPKVRRG